MTTYKTHYDGLEGNTKRAKAIQDIVEYLGWDKFVDLHDAILKESHRTQSSASSGHLGLNELRMMLSFVGVQGYPVKAWYELLFGQED